MLLTMWVYGAGEEEADKEEGAVGEGGGEGEGRERGGGGEGEGSEEELSQEQQRLRHIITSALTSHLKQLKVRITQCHVYTQHTVYSHSMFRCQWSSK